MDSEALWGRLHGGHLPRGMFGTRSQAKVGARVSSITMIRQSIVDLL